MPITQPSPWRFAALVVIAGGCILQTGCVEKPATAVEGALVETLKSPHGPLREELGVLLANGDSPDKIAHQIYEQLQGRTSFMQEMIKLFEYVDTKPLRERSQKLLSNSASSLNYIDLEAIRHLRQTYSSQQEKLHELLKSDPPLGLSPHQAYANDFEFLETFDAAHALLLLKAMEDIAARKPRTALKPLSEMFQLCRKLEDVPVATTRAHAANLRRRTLQVVARMVTQPDVERITYEELANLLREHYANWVSFADIIRGERAMGLMVYEQVRQGEFLSLLSPEEYERLKEEKRLEVTRSSVRKNIDLDETFFLLAMKTLLSVAQDPYYKRLPVVQELRTRMAALAESPEYPYVATQFLLNDMEQVQLALAQDRALFEAWIVLLQYALEGTLPNPPPINPVTGTPFEITQDANRWVITGLQTPVGEEAIVVNALP